jgi:hypothetical protein
MKKIRVDWDDGNYFWIDDPTWEGHAAEVEITFRQWMLLKIDRFFSRRAQALLRELDNRRFNEENGE